MISSKDLIATMNVEVFHERCDCFGQLKIAELGAYMLRLAGLHADILNVGIDKLQAHQMTWVLTKFMLNITELPQKNQKISFKTWVRAINKFGTERCFAVYDDTGKVLATACSNWVVLDVETRRPKFLSAILDSEITTAKADIEIPVVGKLNFQACDLSLSDTLKVKNSDIDINTHLYSMKYLEYVLNLFPISEFSKAKHITMNFLAEVHLGEEVKIYSATSGNVASFEMQTSESEKSVFRASVEL
ncbi:MAG: thioesterase [Candidatus Kapabacteria bacterium]|nr:thioesterase [Candidatus Kapabacteria bacterium]